MCTVGQRLDSIENCKSAGLQLGYRTIKEVSRNDLPIGCYWDINFSDMAFFNTGPSYNVAYPNAYGGICGWKQG